MENGGNGNVAGRLLSVKEAAAYLGLSKQTVYNWRSQGRVAYVKLGRRVLFRPADLDKLIEGGLKEVRGC